MRTSSCAIALGILLVAVTGCRGGQNGLMDAGTPVAPGVDYLGSWAVNDSENQLFNIVIRGDRTVLSNWSKGQRGAQGEQGAWRRTGSRLVISYQDGWTDVLMPSRYGVARQSFRPGTPLDSTPSSFGSAVRVEPDRARFCGVFERVDVEANEYLSLLSSGLAYRSGSSDPDGTSGSDTDVGTWRITEDSASVSWSRGGGEIIEWQRGVYVSKTNSGVAGLLRPRDGLAFGSGRP